MFVLVPYPQSLQLLGVAEGSRRASPPFQPLDRPDTWNGLPAFDFPHGLELLSRVLGGLDELTALLVEMRSLALRRLQAGLGPKEVIELAQTYRRVMQTAQHLAAGLRYRGVHLLDGSSDVFLFERQPATKPLFVPLDDVTIPSLGLDGTEIGTLSGASGSLDPLDSALDTLTQVVNRLSIVELRLEEGSSVGLREVGRLLARMRSLAQEASDGTLNSGDRALLDARFQSDRERIDEVATATAFSGMQLLEGGRVCLQGAPPASFPIAFELPDVTTDELGISNSSSGRSVTSASCAIVKIELALADVARQRQALLETSALLENGLRLRLR